MLLLKALDEVSKHPVVKSVSEDKAIGLAERLQAGLHFICRHPRIFRFLTKLFEGPNAKRCPP